MTQLVAYRTFNPGVGGSTPPRPTRETTMEYKEIYKCEPFRVWVQADGTVGMKCGSSSTQAMSADVAAVLGACLIEASAHVTKYTAKCLQLAEVQVSKAKEGLKEASEVANRFTKLE